jgi:hypothetical protein
MPKETFAEIAARLKGKAVGFADLTAKPNVKLSELVGERITITNARVVKNVGGELIMAEIRRVDGTEVESNIGLSEPTVKLALYFQQTDAVALENVTFVKQGHTTYVATKAAPETESEGTNA